MAVDALFSQVVLLLRCDGANNSTTFTDLSSAGRPITTNGNMKVSTARSKFGGASAYAAADGALSMPSSADFTFGTGDFTWEAWVYFLTTTGNQNIFSLDNAWSLYTGSGTLYFYAVSGNILTSVLTINEWHHIALSRVSGVVYLHVDGVQVATASYTANITGTNMVVGGGTATTSRINGHIDEARITKGTGRYVGSAGHPLTAFPTNVEPVLAPAYDGGRASVALLLNPTGQNNSTALVDTSLVGRALQAFGDAKLRVAQAKHSVAAMYFDGTGDYFKTASAADFQFTGDFAIECWVHPTSNTNSRGAILANAMTSWAAGATYLLRYGTSGTSPGKVAFGRHGTDPLLVSTSTVALNDWTHIAVTRSGSTIRLFVNGTIEATATDSSTWDFSTLGTLLGACLWESGSTGYFTGYIGPVRIADGAAKYTAGFTPPADVFTEYFGALSGNAKDSLAANTDSLVRAYLESTGDKVGAILSDASTGNYLIPTKFPTAHTLVFYPAADEPTPLQAKVLNGVLPLTPP